MSIYWRLDTVAWWQRQHMWQTGLIICWGRELFGPSLFFVSMALLMRYLLRKCWNIAMVTVIRLKLQKHLKTCTKRYVYKQMLTCRHVEHETYINSIKITKICLYAAYFGQQLYYVVAHNNWKTIHVKQCIYIPWRMVAYVQGAESLPIVGQSPQWHIRLFHLCEIKHSYIR